MIFQQWLKEKEFSISDLASKLPVHRNRVYELQKGFFNPEHRPTQELMRRIKELAGEEIIFLQDEENKVMVEALREWLRGNLGPRGKESFALQLGVPLSRINAWLGEYRKISVQDRRKIYEITKLQCFGPSQEKVEEGERKERITGKILEETWERTEKVKHILMLLYFELQWFSEGSPELRKVFRERISSSDVGYLSSLLTMLGQEEQFQRWKMFTSTKFNKFKKGEERQ